LHLIELDKAIALIEDAGFIIEAQSDLLRNEEEYTHNVYDEAIRHKTDRFLIRARSR
jgi:predicted methyltransferase